MGFQGIVDTLNQTLVMESSDTLCQEFCEITSTLGTARVVFHVYIIQHTPSQPLLTATTYGNVLPCMCRNDFVVKARWINKL